MSILTKENLELRLFDKQDLVVSPILNLSGQIEAGSINVRIGCEFIVTKKAEYALLSPRQLDLNEIRKFQEKIYRRLGDIFVLHPRQLVLAGTFEFISLPNDLCAHVVTRSRYGRSGLMVATATYVHPGWKGCLTLELFNYGDVPIEIECGSTIAQLIVEEANPVNIPPLQKYKPIPVGPEFVQMKDDDDWKILNKYHPFR